MPDLNKDLDDDRHTAVVHIDDPRMRDENLQRIYMFH